MKRYDEAEKLYRFMLDARTRNLGPDHTTRSRRAEPVTLLGARGASTCATLARDTYARGCVRRQ